jgi:CTP:molybdopterin cytidylyltransferase MocA
MKECPQCKKLRLANRAMLKALKQAVKQVESSPNCYIDIDTFDSMVKAVDKAREVEK